MAWVIFTDIAQVQWGIFSHVMRDAKSLGWIIANSGRERELETKLERVARKYWQILRIFLRQRFAQKLLRKAKIAQGCHCHKKLIQTPTVAQQKLPDKIRKDLFKNLLFQLWQPKFLRVLISGEHLRTDIITLLTCPLFYRRR